MSATLRTLRMTNNNTQNPEIIHQEELEEVGEIAEVDEFGEISSEADEISEIKSTDNEQYYKFTNPKFQHSLHVIDADYGVFDPPEQRKKTINFKLRTPKIFKKIKENPYFNDNRSNNNNNKNNRLDNQIILSKYNDNFNLRPEPELVDSNINIYNNSNKRSRNNNEKFIPTNTIYTSKDYRQSIPLLDDSDESDYSYNSSDNDYDPANDEYSIFKKSNTISSNKVEEHNDFKKSKNILKSDINHNHKSKIELEYEKIKLRSARYQAERDMLKIKLQHQQMANKLRDYEYYCVNGINHSELHSDNINNSYVLHQPKFQQQLHKRNLLKFEKNSISTKKNKKSSSSSLSSSSPLPSSSSLLLNDSFNETNFFHKLSTNLPPEISSFFEMYADHIPSVQTIREFHNSVLSWILTIPFFSLLYPLLCFLGVLIPKTTKRSWSLRALIVGFLDLTILLITGWVIYNFLRFFISFLLSFVKVAKFLGIM